MGFVGMVIAVRYLLRRLLGVHRQGDRDEDLSRPVQTGDEEHHSGEGHEPGGRQRGQIGPASGKPGRAGRYGGHHLSAVHVLGQ